MTDCRLRFVIPPSVVNHSKPYIIAMISAAVEYWYRPPTHCLFEQISLILPPIKVIFTFFPRAQAVLPPNYQTRSTPHRPG